MVTAAAVSNGLNIVANQSTKATKSLGSKILKNIFPIGLSLPEFTGVYKSATCGFSRNGQKISGINWTSSILEFFKSLPKAMQWFIVPAVISGVAAGACPLVATLAMGAGLALPMGISKLLDFILPKEEKIIAKACKEKGYNMDENGTYLA